MSDWNAVLYDNKHDFVSEFGTVMNGLPIITD